VDECFMAQTNSEVKEIIVFISRLFKISGPLSPQHGISGMDKVTAEPEARVTHVRSPQTHIQLLNFVLDFFPQTRFPSSGRRQYYGFLL